MELIGLQPLVDIIALTLQSAFIKNNATPVSLLLVSEPESAKTTVLQSFSNLDYIAYYDEITSKQLIDHVIPAVKTGKCKYLLIPDLINCIDKQRSTRNQFLATLKSATDDTGIKRIATAYKSIETQKGEQGIRFGVITAVTVSNFKQAYHYMKGIGLLSRFLPFSYKYPISRVIEIFDCINNSKKEFESAIIPRLNPKSTIVKSEYQFNVQLQAIATEIGREYGGYGIRAQVHLQRLALASALLHKRTEVNQSDIDKVKQLSRWMNYKFEVI